MHHNCLIIEHQLKCLLNEIRFGLHLNWCITTLLLHLSFIDMVYSIVGPCFTMIFYIKRYFANIMILFLDTSFQDIMGF